MRLKSFQQSYTHSRNTFTLRGHAHHSGLGIARDPDLESLFGFSDWHLVHTASGLRLTPLSHPIPTLAVGRLALEVLLEMSQGFDWHGVNYANKQTNRQLPDFDCARRAMDSVNRALCEADADSRTATDRLNALRSQRTVASR